MAFMWKEDSSYNYKFESDDDIDKSINKTAERMLQLGAATASNWGGNMFQLMLFKTKHINRFSSYVNNNEFQNDEDNTPAVKTTTTTETTKTIKTIGNKAVKATLVQENGEYVLKLTTVKSITAAEQAETATTLLSQAALLRQLGEKLLLQPEFFKSLEI